MSHLLAEFFKKKCDNCLQFKMELMLVCVVVLSDCVLVLFFINKSIQVIFCPRKLNRELSVWGTGC